MHRIQPGAIDVGALECAVRSDACGAVVTFMGVVRERSDDGRAVTGLSYEAHEAMAVAEFERITNEARARFGECNVSIVHRTGDLRIGETAVAVAVACAHRGSAFDACEYVIDELKKRAPIWKKEHYAEGADSVWKQNDRNAPSRPS
ncbi:MAG TPA: molybdenum cofactor biosynthesis protein MoaE [Candidatus Baltobacteraceae bacterium]